MTPQTPTEPCVAPTATQRHNGKGAEHIEKVSLFGIHAAWLHFANQIELRRLAKLHLRIARKEAALAALVKDRQKIMNRCIRRMRRHSGKN